MHTMSLLEKWLQRNAVISHQARVGALVRVVGALLSGGRLALTHLGRHRAGRAFVKARSGVEGKRRGEAGAGLGDRCGSAAHADGVP